ncbi:MULTISPECIES: GDP-mannose 4,6-dehydratase [Nocardia]|uniref:GDP-mannose 4,6-dehydratase n=1 Tax=Nocardia TaxID=1817 RepID=UPI000D68E730
MNRRALITGVAGQDGRYLVELLLGKGYFVYGIDIDRSGIAQMGTEVALLSDPARITLCCADVTDSVTLRLIVDAFQPSEVYNLAARSHVGQSFKTPNETMRIIAGGTATVLEVLRGRHRDARVYQASSAEMFGNSPSPQNELSRFSPLSPYAKAKLHAHRTAQSYRTRFDMFVCSGILYNHESPIRRPEFVSRRITQGVASIISGRATKIGLGNLNSRRDWGHAQDYVYAMWLMLQQSNPDDYVVATGRDRSVADFARTAFDNVGLNWEEHIVEDPTLRRPLDPPDLCGDASKAHTELGWQPTISFNDLIAEMLAHDLDEARTRVTRVPWG